mmetsp:Transcript_27540/g.58092  ORF Transcript_27540/g.58092 Transcript_27540/m.58092 type:complete len:459 (+) Transcript_27540:743-2119(+)
MVVVVASVVVVVVVAVSVSALLAVFANEDGTSIELSVLKFADGARGFLGFLVEDNSAAFGAAVVSLENVGLVNVSGSAHVILEILPTRLVGEISDVDGQVSGVVVPPVVMVLGPPTPASSSSSAAATGLLAILPDENHASLQLRVRQLLDGLLGPLGSGEFHDSTALRAAVVIGHDLGVTDIAGGAHVVLQILPRHIPREVSDVDPLGLIVVLSSLSFLSASPSAARLAILPDEDLPPHELHAVQTLHRIGRRRRSGELHDAASLGPPVVRLQHVRPDNLSGRLREILEVSPAHPPREVAHVHPAVRGGPPAFGSGGASSVFGLGSVGGVAAPSPLGGGGLGGLRSGGLVAFLAGGFDGGAGGGGGGVAGFGGGRCDGFGGVDGFVCRGGGGAFFGFFCHDGLVTDECVCALLVGSFSISDNGDYDDSAPRDYCNDLGLLLTLNPTTTTTTTPAATDI